MYIYIHTHLFILHFMILYCILCGINYWRATPPAADPRECFLGRWAGGSYIFRFLIFSMNTHCENMAYRSLRSEKYSASGVRKATRGITGLWQPSVHSDVAFWSFDVASSYHWEAEVQKCRIDHPPIGSVSWDWTVVRQVRFTLLMNLMLRQ